MIEGVAKIGRLRALAACLTADANLQRTLVRQMALALLERQAGGTEPDALPVIAARLTDRQQQVWGRLEAGEGIRQIGRSLGISHVAVLKHRQHIVAALCSGAENNGENRPPTGAPVGSTPSVA